MDLQTFARRNPARFRAGLAALAAERGVDIDVLAREVAADWRALARPGQRWTIGHERTTLLMLGRGTGKTRTGGEALADFGRRPDLCSGHAFVAARDRGEIHNTCLGRANDSGLWPVCRRLGMNPGTGPRSNPRLRPQDRLVTFRSPRGRTDDSGLVIRLLSADEPGQFHGGECGFGWVDELRTWRKNDDLEGAWAQIPFVLRLDPQRLLITSTPGVRAQRVMRALLLEAEQPRCRKCSRPGVPFRLPPQSARRVHPDYSLRTTDPAPRACPRCGDLVTAAARVLTGSSDDNLANLSAGMREALDDLEAADPVLARLQRHGDLSALDDRTTQLWHPALWTSLRVVVTPRPRETWETTVKRQLDVGMVVVSVDPSGIDEEAKRSNSKVGLVALGGLDDGRTAVLESRTGHHLVDRWPEQAADMAAAWGAEVVAYEQNYGGGQGKRLVREALARVGHRVELAGFSARGSKAARARELRVGYRSDPVVHVVRSLDDNRLEPYERALEEYDPADRRRSDEVDAAGHGRRLLRERTGGRQRSSYADAARTLGLIT